MAVQARDVTTPLVRSAIAELRTRALATGQVRQPVMVEVSPARRMAQVALPLPMVGAISS